jgi:ABC-2 type transport system permease protein
MLSAKKMNIVAKNTFIELYKSKILLNVLFLGAALLLVTFVAYQFTYGEPERIALDFGLSTLSLSSVGIALFLGVSLISKELESRTVYMVISRPVKRTEFILGKIIGFLSILVLNIMILALLTLSVFLFSGGSYDGLITWTIFYIFLEASIVLLMVVLLSLITTNIVSVFLTLSAYLVGLVIHQTLEISTVKNNVVLSKLIEMYHFVLPGFYKLNIKNYVLYDHHLDFTYLGSTSLYALIYLLMLTILIAKVFNKKNLD